MDLDRERTPNLLPLHKHGAQVPIHILFVDDPVVNRGDRPSRSIRNVSGMFSIPYALATVIIAETI